MTDEIAVDDPTLDDSAEKLSNDTLALVLVAQDPALSEFGSAVEPP